MAAAFGLGTQAACSLVFGAAVALRFRISLRVIALVMAFGAGVLISALAFDLRRGGDPRGEQCGPRAVREPGHHVVSGSRLASEPACSAPENLRLPSSHDVI